MSTTEQKSWMREASLYLNKVKVTFQDEKEKYNIFVDVLRDYKAQRFDHVVSHPTLCFLSKKIKKNKKHLHLLYCCILSEMTSYLCPLLCSFVELMRRVSRIEWRSYLKDIEIYLRGLISSCQRHMKSQFHRRMNTHHSW